MPFCENTNLPRRTLLGLSLRAAGICLLGSAPAAWSQTSTLPITDQQRATADRVAQAGVPLSELAPNAPDSHTVKRGDTLWDISKLFLTNPWRWPELWGMNREQISNPHLIYPGQILMLVRMDGRAQLQLAQQRSGTQAAEDDQSGKLSPRVRSSDFDGNAITAIPLNLIEPFLNDAVVFDTDELATAPRIVATPEGRVLLSRGDLAYARGDLSQATDYRVFRNTRPLLDPSTQEILGYEAPYLGTAELKQAEQSIELPDGKAEIVPATLVIKAVRQEIGVGDRLSPVPQRSFSRYIPHSPSAPINGQIVSIYGEGLNAGQNQIVALNRGRRDGIERGHVLALWQQGRSMVDSTSDKREVIKLPDERHGVLFVFQVYERVSYALIISVKAPVKAGDRFSQP
ncbi:LysM peptidoglycan-binding domain-containing protein [Paucibacter sp. B2R-40]|uniref:LysM peptidoglycan-binding domain-containing protein n=1 Tax=Paucibacter sp. B2R-40 TaxID=2893554 RepID=UPI0021E49BDB|nr:LysM peptidoglycan-binding domain-containing protein [Paucibacter sp. B2R-40]MCV2357101.1 LysM peptidoglycan-binding domain-containing protein [Paucibacter sp. B2R-40]